MLHNFKAIVVFLLWSSIALISHSYFSANYPNYCFAENKTNQSVINLEDSNKIVFTNILNDTVYKFQGTIRSTKNSNQVLFTNITFMDSINSYLNANYDEYLTIEGYYNPQEKNNSYSTNLGIERAKNIKKLAINKGIDSSKIKIFGSEKQLQFSTDNECENAFKLQFKKRDSSYIDSIENNISNKLFYIQINQENKIIDDTKLSAYLPLLKHYLQKYPLKEITITGHTDNNGYYQDNLIKGLAQANSVKEYLLINNVHLSKITTISKGESEPIATKYTVEGKAKNRRIEIKIK